MGAGKTIMSITRLALGDQGDIPTRLARELGGDRPPRTKMADDTLIYTETGRKQIVAWHTTVTMSDLETVYYRRA
jgi:hypothetical protein